MSKEREEIVVKTTPILTAEQIAQQNKVESVINDKMSRLEKKKRLISVLERGVVHDRMSVPLPDDIHGEWVRDNPLDIARMQTLGFELDHTYAPSRSLHSDGSGVARVADVVFMTCPKETKEIIDEIRHEQFLRLNAPSATKEEEELYTNVYRETGGDIPAFKESSTELADRERIAAALKEIDGQTA